MATAWGKLELKTGDADAKPDTSVGIVKAGSFSIEVQDGDTKEWKAIGGKLVDQLNEEPTIRVSFLVKNLENTFWQTESGDEEFTNVKSLVTTKHISLSITPEVKGAEIVIFWKGSVKAVPEHGEDSGYGHKVTVTALYSDTKKCIFSMGKVAL